MVEITRTQSAGEVLRQARQDKREATRALSALSVEDAVGLVCEAPMNRRGELLGLFSDLSTIVPALPEAELCYTAKAVGLHDAGWILIHATAEQLQACIDLDAWRDHEPDSEAFSHWIRALLDAGEETALGVAREIDPEVLSLWLRSRIEVVLKPDDGDFEPPAGSQTLDGQFHYVAREAKDDLHEITAFLRMLFQKDYWHYFRLMQAIIWELGTENAEWALRWRNGRLQDMGFPEHDESLGIYAPLPDSELGHLPAEREPLIGEWALPIWMPNLPAPRGESPSVLYALAELPEDKRREALFRLIALANRVAIADRLPLGDAESLPVAIAKSLDVTSKGLDYLSGLHHSAPVDVVSRAGLQHLFRVGASLDRDVVPDFPSDETEPSDTD